MRALVSMLVLLCGAGPLSGQWYLGLEWGAHSYGGSAHDTSRSHVASDGRPGGGTSVGLQVGRGGRRFGVALRVSYATPGFTVAGQGVSVNDKRTGRLFEAATLLSTRVGGIGPSGAVRAELGPALHLWDYDSEIRGRVGALGAVAYEWPVAGRFSGAVRLEGMLSKSWFDPGEVPPEFARRLTWRYGVTLGLRYRL